LVLCSEKFFESINFHCFRGSTLFCENQNLQNLTSWPQRNHCARIVNFNHTFSQTTGVSEIKIKMALLKYFAPSKTFNVRVCIRKHMACLWVWLHLPRLSSKIKTWKRSKWPIHENFHPRKFPAIW